MAKSKSPQSNDDARLRDLLERSNEPILLLNRQWRLVYANAAWDGISGHSADVSPEQSFSLPRNPSSDQPTTWHSLLAPPDDVRGGNTVQRVRLIPADLFPGEKSLPQWWELTYVPLAASEGLAGVLIRIRPISAVGVFEDPPLPEKIVNLRESFVNQFTLDSLPNRNAAMRRVHQQIRLAISTRSPVIIHGERGVGKQWLARILHTQGPHPEGFFVNIDCRRLPSGAVAAVIFGRQGLIRRVRPCTLHLRDPDLLPRELQIRIAQDELLWNEDDSQLRVTASMRASPDDAIASGQFLEDLYCLLGPLIVELPPLRDRRDDVSFYVERMLSRANEAADATVAEVSPEALALLQRYDWPSNLSELFQTLVAACKRQKSGELAETALPFFVSDVQSTAKRDIQLDEILEKVERRLIELALHETNSKKQAAEMLSIWRPRLLRRIAALGLDSE